MVEASRAAGTIVRASSTTARIGGRSSIRSGSPTPRHASVPTGWHRQTWWRLAVGDTGIGVSRIGDGDTTHLCAIDADGLGVSLTQSNALDFGSHLVAGSTGIFMHNRGIGFSLVPGHPGELGPGRRPPHTLSPMLVTAPGRLLTHLIGAMGGDVQPQILLQLLARMLPGAEDPATALAAARVVLDAPGVGPFRLWWGEELAVLVESHALPGGAKGSPTVGTRFRSSPRSTPSRSGAPRSSPWSGTAGTGHAGMSVLPIPGAPTVQRLAANALWPDPRRQSHGP